MTNKVVCPKCGSELRSLANHKGSKKCDVLAAIKEHKDVGDVKVKNKMVQDWLREHNFYIEKDYTGIRQGYNWRYKRSRFKKGYWTSGSAKRIAESAILPGYTALKKHPDNRYKKLWQNEGYIIVGNKVTDKAFAFSKDTPEITRRRKFLIRDDGDILFTLEGERYGDRVDIHNFTDDKEAEAILTAYRL